MAAGSSRKKKLQVVTPRKATYKDLAVYHTRDYLDFVLDASKSSNAGADSGFSMDVEFGLEDVIISPINSLHSSNLFQDCPPFPGLAEYVQMIGGATLTAVSALQQDLTDIAICWDGGRCEMSSFIYFPLTNSCF